MKRRSWISAVACALPIGALAYGYYVSQLEKQTPQPRATLAPLARHQLRLATDRAAANILPTPTLTTIEEVLQWKRPANIDDAHPRVEPYETTIWTIQCQIVEVTEREDGDYYLVIQSPTGARTVAEAPDPKHLQESHYRKEIGAAREAIQAKLSPTRQPRACQTSAKITGIGHFGRPSRRSNGARLNPIIKIEFTSTS